MKYLVVASYVLLSSCVLPETREVSFPHISTSTSWEVNVATRGLVHKPSGQYLHLTPLNDPENQADELFVWIGANKVRERLIIPASGVRLRLEGREYAAKGWKCPESGPVHPLGNIPIDAFDSRDSCALFQFDAKTPSSRQTFSLQFEGATLNGRAVVIPEVHFAPANTTFGGGRFT